MRSHMSYRAKRELLLQIAPRYREASSALKEVILDEFVVMPLVFLGESSGSRVPDSLGAEAMAAAGQDPQQYCRRRETPWVSAVLGPCLAAAFYRVEAIRAVGGGLCRAVGSELADVDVALALKQAGYRAVFEAL